MAGYSRRGVLRGATGALALGLAGCLDREPSNPRYRLSASNVPESLAAHFRWTTRSDFREADRQLMTDLTDRGTLTTAGFALRPPGLDGPSYVERNGTYYEVTIERAGETTAAHWLLWFDLVDGEPPADAEVYESSLGLGGGTELTTAYGLSPLDASVVEDAAGDVYGAGDPRELEDAPPGQRGHVFVRREPADTALLPEPPFTHVAFDTGDGIQYARVVTERATVELQEYEHSATPIASSPAEYTAYIHDTHLRTTFDRASLPREQREILATITAGGGRYNEREPLSTAMQTILERLGLDEVATPEDSGVTFSDPAYFRYDAGFYAAELEIFR